MTQKELQKKYKNKKVKINFDKILGENFENACFYQNSIDEESGNMLIESYSLNSIILTNLSCLYCMMIDPVRWQDELQLCPFRFDKSTLKFLDDLNRDTWMWQLEQVGSDATEEELSKVNFYIPAQREWFMWKIYLILNELHKYLYDKPMFDFAEEMVNSELDGDKNHIEWILDLKKFRKDLNKFCNTYLEIVND